MFSERGRKWEEETWEEDMWVQKSIPAEEHEGGDWVTLPPSASSSPAPSSAAGRRDRWLVAALLLLTSALSLSLSPSFFPFLYLLPALFIPHRPHAAQLAGVAVR